MKYEMYEKQFKEAKVPKSWNTMFAVNVIRDYKSGRLTKDNLKKWEKDYNAGIVPNPPFSTEEILDYHIETGKIPK